MKLSGTWREFQKAGAAIIVCDGKSSLSLLLLIAHAFGIRTYGIVDCDSNATNHIDDHEKENLIIFKILGHTDLEAFPAEIITRSNLAAWPNQIEEVAESQYGLHKNACKEAGRVSVGHLKGDKNPFCIAAAMNEAWNLGQDFPIFRRLVEEILAEEK